MATVKNNVNDGDGVLLVARSDERMAAVEESKRTGQPLQSVGAKGDDLVKVSGVAEEVRRVSTEQYGSGDYAMQDYLHELIEGVEDREELNVKLAREHQDVSNEIIRKRQEQLRKDHDKSDAEVADEVAELNIKLAQDYAKVTAQFIEQRVRDRNGIEREVREITAEQAFSPRAQTVLGKLAQDKPSDISQSADEEAHKQRERVIYGVDSFKNQAVAPRAFGEQAAADNRAQELDAVDASRKPLAREGTDPVAEPEKNVHVEAQEEPKRSRKSEPKKNNEAEDKADNKG